MNDETPTGHLRETCTPKKIKSKNKKLRGPSIYKCKKSNRASDVYGDGKVYEIHP
jgi:hypothetical protein